ncbi:MAG: hypothetical protein LBN08_02355 [Lactobacillales bacterium]|jgi:very-short-patch-repair endonuclease|nr:hypothetical protein [Lactobacillales bacterium]
MIKNNGQYYDEYTGKLLYDDQVMRRMVERYRDEIGNRVIISTSAAALWRIPILDRLNDYKVIVVDGVSHHSAQHCHFVQRKNEDKMRVIEHSGFYIASHVDTLLELDRVNCPLSVIASINHCLYKGWVTRAELLGTKLRKYRKFFNANCESPFETLVILMIMALGFELPSQQVEIRGFGRFIARVDMIWVDKKLVLESDGLGKVELVNNKDAYYKQQTREWDLRDAGYEVVRVMWRELANGKLEERLIKAGIHRRKEWKNNKLAKWFRDFHF